jgi:hypothetical protein
MGLAPLSLSLHHFKRARRLGRPYPQRRTPCFSPALHSFSSASLLHSPFVPAPPLRLRIRPPSRRQPKSPPDRHKIGQQWSIHSWPAPVGPKRLPILIKTVSVTRILVYPAKPLPVTKAPPTGYFWLSSKILRSQYAQARVRLAPQLFL